MSYLTSLLMPKMMSDIDKMSINVRCYKIHIKSQCQYAKIRLYGLDNQ